MIAELVGQYDTLRRCGKGIPGPCLEELDVSVEITLTPDGLFRVNWLPAPKAEGSQIGKSKKTKEEPVKDLDCPVTERSACRASGDDSPHGIVDNPSWIFGELAPERKIKPPKTGKRSGKGAIEKLSPGELRSGSYLRQLKALYQVNSGELVEVKRIIDTLENLKLRQSIWREIEKVLREKIKTDDDAKWKDRASKINIRWVIERIGSQGRPVNALEPVKTAWVNLQKQNQTWSIRSILDWEEKGEKPARLLHPRIKGASLISFNNPATYCGHLHDSLSEKEYAKGKDTDGSALPAQIGFDEAEKYSKALKWLIENSSVRFGDAANCVWVDQSGDHENQLDTGAHDIIAPQGKKSFSRGRAKKSGGQVLADTDDLIESLRRFRNAKKGGYRDKRFYMLSILLRRKGRHAVLGGFTGTMGELENNAKTFIKATTIELPRGYLEKTDAPREFCPTLMDILDAAGVKSEKKKRLVWDREVIEVIVRGCRLPSDLCRLVVTKAIEQKHLEASRERQNEYRRLLAIGSGCARHYLTGIEGKEQYAMGLDTKIAEAGYLAGRLFAVCENVQKRGRSWGATLSDKLYSAAILRPRQTLGQLYQNCLCYDLYKKDSEWFAEIFDKISLNDTTEQCRTIVPAAGVDSFEFLLGYWHQRAEIRNSEKTGPTGQGQTLPTIEKE